MRGRDAISVPVHAVHQAVVPSRSTSIQNCSLKRNLISLRNLSSLATHSHTQLNITEYPWFTFAPMASRVQARRWTSIMKA